MYKFEFARAMSHVQLSRIDCWELAHRQTYSDEDVYGECRDIGQLVGEVVGMAQFIQFE